MVRLADLTTRSAQANGRNSETSVHEGREYVATPSVDEQYAPEPRVIDPHTGEVLGLATMISGYSTRAKVHGVVFMLQIRSGTDMKNLIEELKRLDPATEFDTEMRKDFGQRGELKRGVLQMVTIESRGDKVTVVAIGPDAAGKAIKADAWLDPPKATELLGTLQLDEVDMAVAQRALDGKESAVLSMAGKGMEFSYREFEKDGKPSRRLAEFHRGGGGEQPKG